MSQSWSTGHGLDAPALEATQLTGFQLRAFCKMDTLLFRTFKEARGSPAMNKGIQTHNLLIKFNLL